MFWLKNNPYLIVNKTNGVDALKQLGLLSLDNTRLSVFARILFTGDYKQRSRSPRIQSYHFQWSQFAGFSHTAFAFRLTLQDSFSSKRRCKKNDINANSCCSWDLAGITKGEERNEAQCGPQRYWKDCAMSVKVCQGNPRNREYEKTRGLIRWMV